MVSVLENICFESKEFLNFPVSLVREAIFSSTTFVSCAAELKQFGLVADINQHLFNYCFFFALFVFQVESGWGDEWEGFE